MLNSQADMALTKSLSDDRFAAAQFRALLDSSSQGIIGVDSAGTIQLINSQAEAMFGYVSGELLGQKIEVLVPERVRIIHAEERRQYSEFPRARSMGIGMDLKGRRRDGSEFSIEISLNRAQGLDEAIVIGLITDITARVELEEHVRQAHKMEALSQLASGVAPHLKNLLNVISWYRSLVLDKEEVRNSLEETSRATDQAAFLTTQLQLFTGSLVAQPKWFDLNRCLSEMHNRLCDVLGENVELDLVLDEDIGEIVADPLQVDQVIVNLVKNARDAMPNSGRLRIETATVETGENYAHWHLPVNPGPHVMLTVSDTGLGLTSQVQERMFEPFFTTKEGSMGLGLATVYGILKDSGGSICVSSEPNHRTTFQVIFPRVHKMGGPSLDIHA